MKKILLRDIVKRIIYENINNPEDLTPIEPGPGQEIEKQEAEESPSEAETPVTPSGPISTTEAEQLIKDTRGKFFTVTFTKKDGSERVMNARLGVKAYLKGGELKYNPIEKGLIPVYDMQVKGYRMVNVSTIKKLKIGNNEYIVNQ